MATFEAISHWYFDFHFTHAMTQLRNLQLTCGGALAEVLRNSSMGPWRIPMGDILGIPFLCCFVLYMVFMRYLVDRICGDPFGNHLALAIVPFSALTIPTAFPPKLAFQPFRVTNYRCVPIIKGWITTKYIIVGVRACTPLRWVGYNQFLLNGMHPRGANYRGPKITKKCFHECVRSVWSKISKCPPWLYTVLSMTGGGSSLNDHM